MKCSATYIQEKINATPDGGVCSLPKDKYYIERCLCIMDRRHITIDGNGSVIVSHYNNGNSEKPTCDVFHMTGCQGVKLCNFLFETDVPVNITGTVETIDAENTSYILSVLPDFQVTGREIFMMQTSCDSDGSFDKSPEYYCPDPDKNKVGLLAGEILLADVYTGCKYDYLGGNRYRVYVPERTVKALRKGQTICVRHSSYGPVSILIKNSRDTAIENVTIHSAGGMGIIVLPRSTNLSLNHYNVVLPKNAKGAMSCNCDGIHITGLCGKLTIKNCDFSGLGDDVLNIHSTAATVTAVDADNGTIKCNYCKKGPEGLLSPDWCQKGDVITVLNPETCNKTGAFQVTSFERDHLCFEDLSGEVKAGDILQNMSFAASVEIDHCNIHNTRARAFVLQTENIKISNCSFYGMPLAAIQAAPDLRRWYEVGPVKNMRIHNNTFEKCGFTDEDCPVITIQDNHDVRTAGAPSVHENIVITKNVFQGKKGRCIFVTSAKGVRIENNEYVACKPNDHFIECAMCQDMEITDGWLAPPKGCGYCIGN